MKILDMTGTIIFERDVETKQELYDEFFYYQQWKVED